MKYRCGIYGGSFNPLHNGHLRTIIRAAGEARRLVVIISDGVLRQEVDVRVRYRWIYQATRHLSNVEIFVLDDPCATKADYDEARWLAGAEKVKSFIGEPIDAVFCGDDYDANGVWKRCYPDAEIVVVPRDGVSSTKIRENVYSCWEDLPQVVRPHYVKKVLLTGVESSGKSTLAQNLALRYDTRFVEEVGRGVAERSGTDRLMLPSDFTEILLAHKLREIELLQEANKVLFVDTDALITRFYVDFLNGKDKERNEALADAIAALNEYDLILFCDSDVAFVQDGDRSEIIAANRDKYGEAIKELYRSRGFRFEIVDGDYNRRFEKAVALVDQTLYGK